MDFQTFHQYNKLVRRGYVKPLACPICETEYVLRVSVDDDPVLQCFSCNTLTQPGIRLWDQVRAVVKEHFG